MIRNNTINPGHLWMNMNVTCNPVSRFWHTWTYFVVYPTSLRIWHNRLRRLLWKSQTNFMLAVDVVSWDNEQQLSQIHILRSIWRKYNSSVLGLTHWGRVTHICVGKKTSLVPMMACGLVGAKPLSEPMLKYCQFEPHELQWNLKRNS